MDPVQTPAPAADLVSLDTLDAAAADSPALACLSPEKRASLLNPRTGYLAHVVPLLTFYQEQPVSLGTRIDVRAVLGHVHTLEALAVKKARAEEALRAVMDAELVEIDRVWVALLEIYGKAKFDRDLRDAEAIANFRKFMKKNKKGAVTVESAPNGEGEGAGTSAPGEVKAG